MKTAHMLDLDVIAGVLEGLEETIIHRLIDRVQFRANAPVYLKGQSGFPGEVSSSLFDLRLRYQEEMDAVFGRFLVPEERPCNKNLPLPKRRRVPETSPLHIPDFNRVNLTDKVMKAYLPLISRICPAGDDGHYGSSSEHDVYAFQAISRRIHYGAFYVTESKFRSAPELYRKLIADGDAQGMLAALTRPEIESKIILRVREKVERIQSAVRTQIRTPLSPDIVAEFYRDVIIPFTKEGELLYLENRREKEQAGHD